MIRINNRIFINLCIATVALFLAPTKGVCQDNAATKNSSRTALELVPDDAALAIVVPDINRLVERADHLRAALHGQNSFVVSSGLPWLYASIGVQDVIDESRPAAAMVVSRADMGDAVDEDDDEWRWIQTALVLHMPIKDSQPLATRFGIDHQKLLAGDVLEIANKSPGNLWVEYVALKNRYALLGFHPNAIKSVANRTALPATLPDSLVASLENKDFIALAGTTPWGEEWESFVKDVKEGGHSWPDDLKDPKIIKLLQDTVPDAQNFFFAANLEDGVHLQLLPNFKAGGTAETALQEIRRNSSTTTLAPLPAGNLLAAIAASGERLKPLAAAKLLLPTLREFPTRYGLRDEELTALLNAFDELRGQLKNLHVGLYATGATSPTEISNRGLLQLVARLETAGSSDGLLQAIVEQGLKFGPTDDAIHVKFRHMQAREQIAGTQIDHLEVVTEGLTGDAMDAMREAFGPAWMKLRMMKSNDQIILAVGTDRELFTQALAISQGEEGRGIDQSEAQQQAQQRLHRNRIAELHFSLQRLLPVVLDLQDGLFSMSKDVSRTTAAAVAVEPTYIVIEFWSPLDELLAIPEQWRGYWF